MTNLTDLQKMAQDLYLSEPDGPVVVLAEILYDVLDYLVKQE